MVFISVMLSLAAAAGAAGPESAGGRDALAVIHSRKSVRHYIDMPVSREQLEVLMKAGMAAPTAADKRPWVFVAVSDRKQLETLAKALPFGKMLTQAGAAIIVGGQPSKSLPGKASQFWIQDCSAASENILLAAEAIGLGAVWIGVFPDEARVQAVRKALGIPANVVPLNVLSIGYPAGDEKPKNKFEPSRIHWERW